MRLKKIGNYQKNIILNYLVKIIGIFLSLWCTRVTIGYLGNTLYGLWVTVASIVSWMSSGDFGVGNGFRNQYAKAFAEDNKERQKALIATAMNTLMRISVMLLFVGAGICEILIVLGLLPPELRVPMDITVAFFCLNLVFSIAQSVSYGQQKSWYVSFAVTGMTASTLVAIVLLQILGVAANLVLFSVVHGLCSLIPNLILIWVLKRKKTDLIHCGILQNCKQDLRKDILGVGMNFFGIQICSIVLYSTDNLIINSLITSEAVTKYSIITKVYDTGQNLFSIMLIALWSAVTYQSAKKNTEWIKQEVKKLLSIWCVYVCGIIVVSLLFNTIVKIWIGPKAEHYEPEIVALFAVYGITISFSSIFVNVVNGLNQVRLQLIVATIGAIMNIPLSVFFVTHLDMGIFGVKLATLIAAILTAIAIPIQAWWLLRENKAGCA